MNRNLTSTLGLAMVAGVLLLLFVVAPPLKAGDPNVASRPDDSRQRPDDGQELVEPAFAPGQLVVKLRTDTLRFSADHALVESYSAHLSGSPVFLVTLEPGASVLEAATTLSQSPDVEYAHPNYVLSRSHPIQGSYPFSDQNFKGDYDNQYASAQLELNQAHQLSAGSGVVVGVIDGGIDVSHPALGGMAVSGHDFVDDDNDANDEPGGPASGHGTFVAGVIHLVAPSATINSYRVMNASGDGDGFTVARAIEQAVADGCSILNISLALTAQNLAVRDAIDRATAQGVLVVGGAGNLGNDTPVYPAAEDNVLAVGALDSLSHKTDFSSYGSYVDICAPGNNVYSAYQKPYYAWWSGTSFSAPFVTGLAALAKQKFPSSDGLQIRNRLIRNAGNIDISNPNFVGKLGAGVLEPVAALTAAVTNDTAIFIPYTLHYTHQQFTLPFAVPFVSGVLISTNAPAQFTSRLVDTGTFAFAGIENAFGETVDSVEIFIRTTDNLGTYYNTIAFDVAGVAEPVFVTVTLTVVPQDTIGTAAWLNPSEVWFNGSITTDSFFSGHSVLMSSNAPANYHSVVLPASGRFTALFRSTGQTNDTVGFLVRPNRLLSPGLYTDTVVYFVDGIPNPAMLLIHLNATDSGTQNESGYVFPEYSYYTAPANVSTVQHSGLGVGTYGSPKPYTASMLDHADFTQLTSTTGTTLDSIRFDIITTPNMPAGIYNDTIVIQMPGAPNSPLMAILTLRVDTSQAYPLCSLPGDVNWNGIAYEYADLAALQLALSTGNISHLGNTIGNADVNSNCVIDTFDFAKMERIILGLDTVLSAACGFCTSYMFVPFSDTSHGGGQQCNLPGDVDCNGIRWTVADLVALTKALDSGNIGFLGPVIGNSDLDGNCRIDTIDRVKLERYFSQGFDTSLIVTCASCSNYTFVPANDTTPNGNQLCSLTGDVNWNGLPWEMADLVALQAALNTGNVGYLGQYVGNADVTGDCIIDSLDRVKMERVIQGIDIAPTTACGNCANYVFMADTVGGPSGDSAWAIPSSISFYAPNGSTTVITNQVVLLSSITANYAASHSGSGNWLGFDPTGKSNDTVLISVNPSGLQPGIHVDTVIFLLNGITKSVNLPVILTVTGSDSLAAGPSEGVTLTNYPNPFNPNTECLFSLPVASHVTLKIYDITGREVITLVDESKSAGTHRVMWQGKTSSGSQASSGVYFYRLEANGVSLTRKMLLLK